MADLVLKMSDSTISAFENTDIASIEGIADPEEEVEVDNHFHRIFRESLACMEEGPSNISI